MKKKIYIHRINVNNCKTCWFYVFDIALHVDYLNTIYKIFNIKTLSGRFDVLIMRTATLTAVRGTTDINPTDVKNGAYSFTTLSSQHNSPLEYPTNYTDYLICYPLTVGRFQ